jgi:gluconate 2-dehydrogenase gamma chain
MTQKNKGGVTRRGLLWAGGLAAIPLPPASAFDLQATGMPWEGGRADHPRAVDPRPGYLYFTSEESACIEALTERFVPKDELGPGAIEIGVPLYIDRQLAGPYGQGGEFYMQGPWSKGETTQGYQSKLPPAGYYRAALKNWAEAIAARHQGATFDKLKPEEQDSEIKALQGGQTDLKEIDAKSFFTLLLQHVREGLFSDPIYGGNRNMAGWKLIGFPGARYDHRDWVTRHNQRYDEPPVGLSGADDWKAN